MKRAAPVQEGQVLELEITGFSHAGEGIGRYAGFTVFVPYAVPGERVLCRVEQIRKGFAIAKLDKVLDRAEIRQEPACPDFFKCGGSHLQHISYSAQLAFKQKVVADAVQRIGKLGDVPVHFPIGMEMPWRYRNKAAFQVADDNGRIRLGFFAEETHQVVAAYDCMLLHRQISEFAAVVEMLLNKYKVPAYDWKTHRGILRHVVIRRSWAHNKVMIVLVTTSEKCINLHAMARDLHRNPSVVSVVRNINDGPGRNIFGNCNVVLAGRETIEDKLCGLTFVISPTSFFQVNPVQTEILYQKVRQYAVGTGKETVLDLYCGIGTIALYLAQFTEKVIGLEVHEAAVADAAANARINGIGNAEFIVGRAEDRLPKLAAQGVKADVVVVDPPRKGVDKRALQAICDIGPERIVYVSCDPASMARDLHFLRHRGYGVREIQTVDMFPQTHHVECIVQIKRAESRMG
ncbi:23S rRNA (uracil(1939)-C(5))-methyltransferase RlmD [Thermincola ferriacetica]|nr:23S rRNA (uracil(1939)-C(5))-methyltransferase RlmD [Thermincola ferriacetica]